MKHPRHSFRSRLLAAFLVVSLVPLLICSVMLVQISRLRMNSQTRQDLQELSANLLQSMEVISTGFSDAAAQLQGNAILTQALSGAGGEDTLVNNQLFLATDPIRDYASLMLCDLEGVPRYSTESTYDRSPLPTGWGVLYAAANAPGQSVYVTSQYTPDENSVLLRGAVLLKGSNGHPIGYLVMEMGHTDLLNLLEGKYGSQGNLLILSPFWHPVYASHSSLYTSLAPQFREDLMKGIMPGTDSDNYMYQITLHAPTGLYLVLQQPLMFNRSTTQMLYTASISCAVICVVISVVMCLALTQQFFSPIKRLQQAFGKLEKDDMSVQLSISRQDELGQLANEFNHMVTSLKLNREELVRNQRELNEAQIRMLQAQLNPHFLCNTLDTMKWISKINHVPQVAEISADLADILRFCISPEEFVPLARELAVLERYIDIQKIRLSDDFAYETSVQEGLYRCMIPKMILQPIVENAIIHGLQGVNNSVVKVEIAPAGTSHIRITVTDNGHGLPDDMIGKPYQKKRSPDGKHLGLYNVNLILTKHFGQDSALHLDVGPGGIGTAVTATLPVYMEENEHAESIDCGR